MSGTNLISRRKLKDRLPRWLFILLFWAIWLSLPFIMLGDDNERHRLFLIKILPATLSNIPLFFLNSEWLAQRLLLKQRTTAYLLSLLGLAIFFIYMQGFMKNWLLAPDSKGVPYHANKSVIYVLFILAVSTGYALVTYMSDQDKARQEEKQERLQSELSFLRSQISPHFIFNILNSIVYLIRSGSALAEPVTIKLSELMRYMLYESSDTLISLEKEIAYLKNYIELQKLRFEEDVKIRTQIAGEAGTHIIEPMLMIPFVENAFKHGVGLVENPEIDIDLKIKGNELTFVIRNKISSESQESKDSSSGIGLQNVRRRLELLYPDNHRLDILQNEWFEIRLWLKLGHGPGN